MAKELLCYGCSRLGYCNLKPFGLPSEDKTVWCVWCDAVPKANSETKPDNVNHPKHYETGKYECIDVMGEALGIENQKGFCLCNAFKYLYRCTKKHASPVEDVKKAVWYLNKFLELEGSDK